MLQFLGLLIFPVSWTQKKRMNYNSQKTQFFHFCFSFRGKDKTVRESQDFLLLSLLLCCFAYSISYYTNVTLISETLLISFDLLASIIVKLNYILLSRILLLYLSFSLTNCCHYHFSRPISLPFPPPYAFSQSMGLWVPSPPCHWTRSNQAKPRHRTAVIDWNIVKDDQERIESRTSFSWLPKILHSSQQ